MSEEDLRQGRVILETRSDVLIRVLWEIYTESIIDISMGDPDHDTHNKEPMKTLRDLWGKGNKDKYNKNFHKNVFSLYLLSLLMACLEMRP